MQVDYPHRIAALEILLRMDSRLPPAKSVDASRLTEVAAMVLDHDRAFQQLVRELAQRNVKGICKSQRKSEKAKAKGDELVGASNYVQALKRYSEALQYADETSEAGISFCSRVYCNRQAAGMSVLLKGKFRSSLLQSSSGEGIGSVAIASSWKHVSHWQL